MTSEDRIIADIGRKCADDISAVLRRNMSLLSGQREAMIISAYGAAAAIGAANGAFAAYMGGPEGLDAEFVDGLWAKFLRPLVLGEFAISKATGQQP